MVVLRPCLLPVQASMVKRVGERGRAHSAVDPRSAPVVAVGLLIAVPWSMCAYHGAFLVVCLL